MAVIYGHDSDYIKEKRTKFLRLAIIFIIFLLASIFIFYWLIHKLWLLSPITLIFIWPFATEFLKSDYKEGTSTFKLLFRKFRYTNQGLLGEKEIRNTLATLPNSYSVFRGLRPNRKNDIDFIVIGPNGVFAIEAKSSKGFVTFGRNNHWQQMLQQTRRETFELHDYLQNGWGIKIFVVGILVFTNNNTTIKKNDLQINNIFVIKPPELVPLITSHRGTNPQKAMIENYLKLIINAGA